MKASVLIVTYNHESYIAEALESALMQQTNFAYEIVIGEDCSTDRTRSIVCDYQKRYPDRIRTLLHEKNLGMMANFMATYRECRGEYIAMLDGDDFWTSPVKLATQVEFLDTHPEFAISFHNASVISEIDARTGTLLCPPEQKEVSTLEDLLYGNFIPTLTAVFRNRLFARFPEWFSGLLYGDWPLHLLNARSGNIGYLNSVMATYRIHGGGAASGATGDFEKFLRNVDGIIEVYRKFDRHLDGKYTPMIRRRIAWYSLMAARACVGTGRFLPSISYLGRFVLYYADSLFSTKKRASGAGIEIREAKR